MSRKWDDKTIIVRTRPGRPQQGLLNFREWRVVCALGRSGVRALKREGDGATPLGSFRLRQVFYRADRGPRPRTRLPLRAIRADDGWCDDPTDFRYNRPVRLPVRAGHETMMRDDGLYDLVVVLSHNERPRVLGGGSAVFFHCARPDLAPTQGCIALPAPTLRRMLAECGPETEIVIL